MSGVLAKCSKNMSIALLILLMASMLFPYSAWATIEDEDQTSLTADELLAAISAGAVDTQVDSGDSGLNANSRATMSASHFEEYSGAELYDTAAAQSAGAFASSEYAIVVGRGGWPDALSATSLAGVYRCPILFTEKDSVPAATASELARLGVSHILLVGGPNLVSQGGLDALGSATGAEVERIWGESLFDTQMAVYERGAGQWSGDLVIVATGADFPDALSIAPVAYAKKAPVFLVSGGGLLPEQKTALMDAARSGSFANAAIAGGTNVVSEATEGFMDAVTVLASGRTGGCVRLAGAELYDTSAAVAEWAVSTQGFSWAAPAFATGGDSYDALAGSVLQGESGSVLLLVDDPQDATVRTAASHAGDVSSVRFFGGRNVVSSAVRMGIADSFGYSYASLPGFRVYIDAGHGWNDSNNGVYDSGATGCGYQEATLAKELAGMVANILRNEYGVSVYLNDDGGWYKLRHAEAVAQKCDTIVSIHFNAGGGSGTESLIHEYNAAGLSPSWQSQIHPHLIIGTGLHDRGMKRQEVAILGGPLPATLLEVAFIDSQSDMNQYQARKVTIAYEIAAGIVE